MGLKSKISLERALSKLASFQFWHYKEIIIVALIITLILGYGVTKIQFEGNIAKEMPQDVPVFALEDKVASEFRGEETMIITVCLNEETSAKNIPQDIRDPKVIKSLVELHERLEAEPSIEKVQSVAPFFQDGVPDDLEGVKRVLASVPGSESFFNNDFSIMLVYTCPIAGLSEEKVKEVTDMMEGDIAAITKPAGVDYKITGTAPLVIELLKLLREDFVNVTLYAAIIILALLILLERSFTKGLLVFLPLVFALIWTFGAMSMVGIRVSVDTACVGPMIVGLGVEYGIFMVSRYYEERGKEKDKEETFRVAVSTIGASTFGSATTTSAAFLSFLVCVFPTIRDFGVCLAFGIISCWVVAVVINPCFIVFEEHVQEWWMRRGGK
jgi:hypothetical protein